MIINNISILVESVLYLYFLSLVGRLVFDLFKISFIRPAKQIAYSLLVGYATFTFLGFMLSVFGFFSKTNLIVCVAIVLFLNYERIWKDITATKNLGASKLSKAIRNFFHKEKFLKLLVVLWLCSNFIIIFVPLTGGDALTYHIPMMADIIKNGKIVAPIANIADYGYFPAFVEISYAIPTLLFNNTHYPFIFQVLQFASLLLTIFLAVDFTYDRVKEKSLVWILVLAILSIFDLQQVVMDGGYIDSFVTLLGIASTLLTIEAVEGEFDSSKFYLGAFILGIAISSKYTSLFFIPINLFIIFLKNNPFKKLNIKRILAYLSLAFVVSAYWYIRNFIELGNPIFPLFSNKIFGSTIHVFQLERTFLNFIIFPIRLFAEHFFYAWGAYNKLIISIYYIFIYIGIIVLFIKKKFNRIMLSLLIATETYLFFVFMESHLSRYALPSTIFATILLFFLIDKIYGLVIIKYPTNHRKIFLLGYVLACVIFIMMLGGNYLYFREKFYFVFGKYSEDQYISSGIGNLQYVTSFINKNLQNEKVLVLWPYAPKPYLSAYYLANGNTYVDITDMTADFANAKKGESYFLKNLPGKYFIISDEAKKTLIQEGQKAEKILSLETKLLHISSPIYSSNGVKGKMTLYEIREAI